jgi:PEP-CTERM motif
MKKSIWAIGFAVAVASANSYGASQYRIDSGSYVDAWVPVWTSYPAWNVPLEVGEPPPPIAFDWILAWEAQRFALSGIVALNEESSPYKSGVSHLNFASADVQTGAPASTEFFLPSYVTRIDTWLRRSGSPGWSDPFFDDYVICFCATDGSGWAEYEGFFDGTRLQLSRTLVGGLGPPNLIFSNLPEQPLVSPEQLAWGSGMFTFNLTAHVTAVPEPDIAAMLLVGLGIVGLGVRRRAGARRASM